MMKSFFQDSGSLLLRYRGRQGLFQIKQFPARDLTQSLHT
jgi:hypothetical protein